MRIYEKMEMNIIEMFYLINGRLLIYRTNVSV